MPRTTNKSVAAGLAVGGVLVRVASHGICAIAAEHGIGASVTEDGVAGRVAAKVVGLAESDAAARVSGFAEEVGGGADFLLWLGQNRRMSKDYVERLCASAEAFVYAAMIGLMVRRLARG